MIDLKNHIFIFLFAGLFFHSCTEIRKAEELTLYEGPVYELNDLVTYYSDSATVKLKLVTPKQEEFENKDRQFPNGIYLEFYEKDGSVSTTLEANYCYFYANENKWRALGNVIVKNLESSDELHTEELYWDPKKEIVYTNKFVSIQTEDEIIMGEGLEASQDFTWWSISDARGTITLDEKDN